MSEDTRSEVLARKSGREREDAGRKTAGREKFKFIIARAEIMYADHCYKYVARVSGGDYRIAGHLLSKHSSRSFHARVGPRAVLVCSVDGAAVSKPRDRPKSQWSDRGGKVRGYT